MGGDGTQRPTQAQIRTHVPYIPFKYRTQHLLAWLHKSAHSAADVTKPCLSNSKSFCPRVLDSGVATNRPFGHGSVLGVVTGVVAATAAVVAEEVHVLVALS